MREPSTWRELLDTILQIPKNRERMAKELGINQVTLDRWVKGTSIPRRINIQRLLEILPDHRTELLRLLEKDFEGISAIFRGQSLQSASATIPPEFYARVLHTCATIPRVLRFASLCDLILRQALEQLDPNRLGLAVIVAKCVDSPAGKVRSLREVVGRGTTPWRLYLEEQGVLLGAESLAGYAVISNHFQSNPNLREGQVLTVGYRGAWEESAVAAPITLMGDVSGSLLVSSTQADYFSPDRCQLVENYADLLMMAFTSTDFYELQSIELGVMSPPDRQQSIISTFRQRVSEIMRQAAKGDQLMNILKAEHVAWQQIEEELLKMS